MNYGWLAAVLSVCFGAMLIWMFRRHREWIVNFVLRVCMGVTLMYGVKMLPCCSRLGIEVGINPVTAGIAGVLGVPGILVMYGIAVCFS